MADVIGPILAYKIVVTDLDGTLLDPEGKISPRTKAVVEEVRLSGARFVIATARPLIDAIQFAKSLDISEPIICQNGALIAFSPCLTDILDRMLLPCSMVSAVVDAVRDQFSDALVAIDYPFLRLVDPNWPGPFGAAPCQTTLWPLRPNELPRQRAACVMIRNAWSDIREVEELFEVTATTSLNGLIEISRKGADKAHAVKQICKHFEIEPENVVTFGDMPNDLSMLRYAGLGVAMSNASEIVRQAADIIAPSNDQDGVAAILESLLQEGLISSASSDALE